MPAGSASPSSPDAQPSSGRSHVLLLFAPKFRDFGIDVARELVRRDFADVVDGVCTGGARVTDAVRAGLGEDGGDVIDIEAEETTWAGRRLLRDELAALAALPVG